jgi:glycosyltransferase involved in cell wall biosynthesis
MPSEKTLRVLALEPYYGLSHKTFLEGYRAHSRHEVEILSLPARKWKWRMRGAAYRFAEKARALPPGPPFDVLLTSDFLNLPDWRSLAPRGLRDLPALVYFHENQITYPLGQHAPVDFHYGWINLSTVLAADRVLFNSLYHREEFLGAVRQVFRRMPDEVPESLIAEIPARTAVFPVGIDFRPHDEAIRRNPGPSRAAGPTILWNHRWEYDKGPEAFFDALIRLRREDVPFRLVVCGQSFRTVPPVFARAREALADRIDRFGFFENQEDYLDAARKADVVVSTAVHEFFGVSIIEAVYLGCLPVLPKRLSYPEIVPPHLHPFYLYPRDEDLPRFLKDFLARPPLEYREELQRSMALFSWARLAPDLDEELAEVVARGR